MNATIDVIRKVTYSAGEKVMKVMKWITKPLDGATTPHEYARVQRQRAETLKIR